jgi:hypothetical protein
MLNRRVPKVDLTSFSIEDLFLKLNKKYVDNGTSTAQFVPSWMLVPTVWNNEDKRYMVVDSRDLSREYSLDNEEPVDMLPPYYGSTMKKAIINAIDGENL